MLERLLVTKFHIPTCSNNWVPRQRLFDVLNAARHQHRRLTLVSAPAGYGKSTLVAEWIRSQRADGEMGNRFAWLSLDQSDNDPVRFLHYFVGALRLIQPDIGQETLSCLEMPVLPPVESILCSLINELASWDTDHGLVLDDYHFITHETVHEVLRFLLDSAPPRLHLVVITRDDPPFLLSRLRARGHLTELRAAQLRFTDLEAELFFKSQGLALKADWLSILETRTEGWVTGLILAALSLQGREDPAAFFQNFRGSHRLVTDYLIDEVLLRVPAETRQFMYSTAILDRLCAALCEAVTGNQNARAILTQIEKANLFLIPLDDQRVWYRYHHLFADSLATELEQSNPSILTELHRRAAAWFDENNQPTAAIQHALAAHDHRLLLAIVRHWIDAREQAGAYAELTGWFRAIPDQVLAEDLPLLYRKLRVYYRSGDYAQCETVRDYLEQKLDQAPDQMAEDIRSLRINLLFEKAVFASMQGELEQADQFLQHAQQTARPDNAYEQLQLAFYQGINRTYLGRFDEALSAYQTCLDWNLKVRLYWNAANCLANMLEIYCTQGQFQLAIQTGENFIRRYEREISTPGYLEGLHAALGTAYYATNQLDLAERLLRQTYDSSLVSGSDDNYGGWRLWLATICHAQGKTEEAEALIRKSEPWVAGFPGEQFKLYAGAIRSRIRLAQGRLAEPRDWALKFMMEQSKPYFKEFQFHTLAWLWAVGDRPGDALDLLQERLPQVEARRADRFLVENLALQALALKQLNRRPEALEQLRHSMALAHQQHQTRILFDLGLWIQDLFKDLHSLEPMKSLLAGSDASFAKPEAVTGSTSSPLVESFHEREVEILHLINQGLSNKEMAARLHLSLSTIKWYTYHLYEKLGVGSRTQAIQRARELKIL